MPRLEKEARKQEGPQRRSLDAAEAARESSTPARPCSAARASTWTARAS